jgi:hypothetical protein
MVYSADYGTSANDWVASISRSFCSM